MNKVIFCLIYIFILFFISCNAGNNTFNDELCLVGFVQGKIKDIGNNEFGIDGYAYPNMEGSGNYKNVRFQILKNENQTITDYQQFFNEYVTSQNTFSFIFQIRPIYIFILSNIDSGIKLPSVYTPITFPLSP